MIDLDPVLIIRPTMDPGDPRCRWTAHLGCGPNMVTIRPACRPCRRGPRIRQGGSWPSREHAVAAGLAWAETAGWETPPLVIDCRRDGGARWRLKHLGFHDPLPPAETVRGIHEED